MQIWSKLVHLYVLTISNPVYYLKARWGAYLNSAAPKGLHSGRLELIFVKKFYSTGHLRFSEKDKFKEWIEASMFLGSIPFGKISLSWTTSSQLNDFTNHERHVDKMSGNLKCRLVKWFLAKVRCTTSLSKITFENHIYKIK